jgi:hypothetical protein
VHISRDKMMEQEKCDIIAEQVKIGRHKSPKRKQITSAYNTKVQKPSKHTHTFGAKCYDKLDRTERLVGGDQNS